MDVFLTRHGARIDKEDRMTSGTQGRSKEGIPTWDGSANTFQAYEEQVLVWEQGIKYENRYLCGPRLAGELTGAVQRMIVGKPATWVSFNGGVAVFLQHLRQSLGKPQIPEATEFLNKYFRNSKRRVGESVNDYITRKTETYWRACQALRRVMPKARREELGQEGGSWQPPVSTYGWSSRRSSWTSNATENEETETSTAEPTEETWAPTTASWNSWGWNSYGSWSGYPSYGYQSWTWHRDRASEAEAAASTIEILPEFVQAWYLLADAGLTTYERNLIHTAVAGEYTLARVSHELRTQHGDVEHRRREQGGQAFMGDEILDEAYEVNDAETEEPAIDLDSLNEEGSALWAENQAEIESAYAVMREARRTLKMAREKQHQVKYFQPKDSGPKDDSNMTCLRCGKIGHRARNCPVAASSSSTSGGTKQMAPFVCYAETQEEALTAGPTTQEAIQDGYCVVDGGATRTLGSVKALEQLFKKNVERYGEDRVQSVDLKDRPTFGFGNSTEGQCLSTIHLGVNAAGQRGKIVVHALDEGEGPVLFSIDALRKLKALIDFEKDLIVFRALDPCKVVPLKRSQTGHQLLDLTADLFEKARGTMKPVPSLDETRPFLHAYQRAMMKMNQAQLREAILARGEEAPREWSNVELRDRLTELMELGGETVGNARKTDLRQWISDLNKASRKKEQLKNFCEERLKITLQGNETIPMLQKRATKVIYEVSIANALDPVGFGKFSTMTYGQVRREQPQYSRWVQETLLEGGNSCDYRLIRLGTWLMNQPDEDVEEEKATSYPAAKSPARAAPKAWSPSKAKGIKTGKGYNEKINTSGGGGSSRDAPAAGDHQKNQADQMKIMMETMMAMKEEIQQLREPRRKKKEHSEAGTTENSHAVVMAMLGEDTCKDLEMPRPLSLGAARVLETESWNAVPKLFSSLTQDQRPLLMEVTCEKEGVLAEAVRRAAGSETAAVSCPLWNARTTSTTGANYTKEYQRPCRASKRCSPSYTTTADEALAGAIRVFNHREQVRGFTPAQLALGRNADDTDRFVPDGHRLPPDLLVENAEGEFQRDVQRRATAERAHVEWHARQRLLRAKHSRPRRAYDYVPGELVFFWRSQESNKHRRAPGGKHGRFLGPARVLATETRRDEEGRLRPGSSVWCIRGKQLIKCCPEQLRRASERESLIEELSADIKVPWTFTKVAEELGGNQYLDVSKEVPEEMEWQRAQDVDEEAPPPLRRIRHKRPEAPAVTDEMDDEQQPPPQRPRQRENLQAGFCTETWQERVTEHAWSCEPVEYWMSDNTAVAVETDLPDSNRGRRDFCGNLETYFVGAMKRKAVEISEKHRSPAEKAQFRDAKPVEVKNFIAAEAFKSLPQHLQPSASHAVGMRWILTWKLKEDGTRKAKARAVLLGYQDPAYEHRSTTSPVMTRQTRQMFLQYAAWKKWTVKKGDVSGAFLQGREYPDRLHCVPCPEILEAMNLPPGSVTQLMKACYGLVDAPLEWYKSVDTFLKGLGLERSWSDPCVWYWRVDGVLRGAICGHVDDFLFMGSAEDAQWTAILDAIQKKFKWGDWETDVFTQCGVRVEKNKEGFSLSQPGYANEVKEIPLSATRRKEDGKPITDWERTQLRTLLGALSWNAQQVAPHLSAEVSLLLSETSQGTVHTIKKANILLRQAQARHQHTMQIHQFPETTELALFAWVDAASQNRQKGGSTQGIFIGMAPLSLAKGEVTEVTPIAWHSSKIDRACRSPGAAEVQAACNGDDSLYYARYQWSEMLYGNVNIRVLVIKGAEKRANIELLSVKASQQNTELQIRELESGCPVPKLVGSKFFQVFVVSPISHIISSPFVCQGSLEVPALFKDIEAHLPRSKLRSAVDLHRYLEENFEGALERRDDGMRWVHRVMHRKDRVPGQSVWTKKAPRFTVEQQQQQRQQRQQQQQQQQQQQ
ncbi:Retrovirus-related Pol polyprotein from transposon TNT 1-94 [Symbiodinium microadriaticum]|uniref:Retrovirus-related Pol polyprotein from transposon TNT 1-94 n=1 Tax=Symbiodinium microadriaticum TaxID=2951 RepID=A0A1Q9DJ13_SYMMI|nr:Retrovirus-related Pol polyprotein from transposon TNT 1-94 [Symbiodinium microadriaticum]